MTDNQKWTWPEIVAAAILLPPTLMLAMWVIGSVIDTAAQHSETRDQCLRAATNGYEIRQCR